MTATARIRPARVDGPDGDAVSTMLGDYHAQTEAEKIEHGLAEPGPLPRRYAAEVGGPRHPSPAPKSSPPNAAVRSSGWWCCSPRATTSS